MKIYLASAYPNKKIAQAVATVLSNPDHGGYVITSTWHKHGLTKESWDDHCGMARLQLDLALEQKAAVQGSDMLIWLANSNLVEARADYGDGYRAGAPIEYGIAVGSNVRVLYCSLDDPKHVVTHFARLSMANCLRSEQRTDKERHLVAVLHTTLGLWPLA